MISSDLAIPNSRIREAVDVFWISDGLSPEDIRLLGYTKFETLQQAVDAALERFPNGGFGVLPRGGDCLPILKA
ncbi:MAG: hypothetical protein HQK55_18270 [Deltaproteobacteria bacterium]|nr:hypothetical protein [Deltaproteobacteria bacterium]